MVITTHQRLDAAGQTDMTLSQPQKCSSHNESNFIMKTKSVLHIISIPQKIVINEHLTCTNSNEVSENTQLKMIIFCCFLSMKMQVLMHCEGLQMYTIRSILTKYDHGCKIWHNFLAGSVGFHVILNIMDLDCNTKNWTYIGEVTITTKIKSLKAICICMNNFLTISIGQLHDFTKGDLLVMQTAIAVMRIDISFHVCAAYSSIFFTLSLENLNQAQH